MANAFALNIKSTRWVVRLVHTNLNYCHRCGDYLSTRRIEGRQRHWCQSCESPIYSNPKPCAGVFVVKEDRVLLIKRTRPPGVGTWSVPAGYLEVDEPPQVAAIRELNEETNVSASRTDLSLLDTQFVTHPDGTTVIVIVYYVSYSNTSGTITSGDDAAAATFFSQTAIESGEVTIESGYRPIALKAIDEFE
ncbi:MAG: ADP-ribose pyrophosphatase [Haloquadratum walsbyi J07HQW1]|uniref:ADP-ribose pyrophosphatase n=1 Tax=Haloquadratum walsbyi J07HQW1 TaxID=1238424 RepID=U1MKD1_9EURY|nr:MAG: ADP-ribose pyrophosphatase [Haloquadratum walsbyi J07HQW1]